MIPLLLLGFIPVSLALAYIFRAPAVWIFATAILAILPLSIWVQRSTEQIALRAGPSIGGLLNVTFGNAPELILALFVLVNGSADVVKGQITGSIIGNSLLGLGLAILIGSFGRSHQTFNREKSGQLSSLLILVMIGLILPALFDFTERSIASSPNTGSLDEYLSLGVSIVLISLYIANLIYTFVTHRDIFSGSMLESEQASWPLWLAILILIFATVLTALEAELVSSALESTANQLGVSTFFLGVIVLALIGNASEYVSAMYFARQNQMSLAMSITLGSTIQIGLLVAPVLVLVSFMIGHPMNLVFANPIEMIAIAIVAFVVNAISQDGQVTWFEGAMLLGVYIMLGIAFFFVTPPI